MKKRGIGFASVFQGATYHFGHRDEARIRVEVTENNHFQIYAAISDIGQGLEAALRILLAEALGGIPPRFVEWAEPSTATSPNAGATGASRVTTVVGNAVWLAGQELKTRLIAVAAGLMGAPIGETRMEGERFCSPNAQIGLQEVLAEARRQGVNLRVEATFAAADTTPLDENGQGEMPVNQFGYATHIAEVEVDTETGEVQVLRVVAIHDSGKIINPIDAEGQVEGGVVMGLGQALTEHLIIKDGVPLTESFSTYLIPTTLDAPLSIESEFVDGGAPFGEIGVKGLAEIPCVAILPAIINAIYNATGARIRTLPATPEQVWRAIRGVTGTREATCPEA